MGTVSLASVENLSDLVASLAACREGAEDSFREETCELERLVEEADANQREANQALEEARQRVAQCQAEVARIESEMENADPPDNPGPSQSELEAAQEELDDAKAHELACRVRLEEAVELFKQAQAKQDSFLTNVRLSHSRIDDLVAQCAARANRAREALENYLAANPTSSAATFAAWARWTPAPGQIVNPGILASRLKFSPDQLRQAVLYCMERIPSFNHKIENYRAKFQSARSDVERDAVQTQCKRNLSGELVERLVKDAFRPIGDVSTQRRVYFDDGHYTKIDLKIHNLKTPVLFGRGERAFAPIGGVVSLEVKAGHAKYLKSQKDHLIYQAGGHQDADASATICTADIHDLSEAAEHNLRDAVRAAGSPILGMLPRKDDIDQAILDAIAETEENS